MRIFLTTGVLAALALLSGCARSKITTEIRADGSWLRTVSFTGQDKKEDMQMTPALEDTFVFPTGAGWKPRQEKKNDDRTMIFERVMPAGRSLEGDLSIKGDGPEKLQLVNEVTVTRAAPGRFEYRETLRWKGSPPTSLGVKTEDLAEIKAALPKPLATDANAKALAEKSAVLFLPLLFGPGDPLLAMGLVHPDLAERRASQRIGGVLMKALEEQFGDKMLPAQRQEVARRLIKTSFSSGRPSKPDMSAGPSPSGGKNSGGLTPLMFILKPHGRVVSSNGEMDELNGEVYWALFPEAAALKDLVLTAVVENAKK